MFTAKCRTGPHLEVQKHLGTQLLAHLILVLSGINGDNTASHGLGVLHAKVADTAASAGDDDPVAGLEVGFFEGGPDGCAGALKPSAGSDRAR